MNEKSLKKYWKAREILEADFRKEEQKLEKLMEKKFEEKGIHFVYHNKYCVGIATNDDFWSDFELEVK